MPKLTQKEALINALTTSGWSVVQMGTKTVKMKHPEQTKFLFIGNAGSLRRGMNKTSSIPVAEATKQQLLNDGGYHNS